MGPAEEMTPSRRARRAEKQRTPQNPPRLLTRLAVEAMLDRKATDIAVLDLRESGGSVADYFVIATGGSDRQIRAVANAVDAQIKEEAGERPWHKEGFEHLQWVLLDYVDVVVHIFSEEKRSYYDLERLWGDARIERLPDGGEAEDLTMLKAGEATATEETISKEDGASRE